MTPRNAYEVMTLLERYHQLRRDNYQELGAKSHDNRVELLFEHLAELEETAFSVVGEERAKLDPKGSTYLLTGSTLPVDPAHAADCQCGAEPSFDDAVGCALSSDDVIGELIGELAASSAAPSVQQLAKRLREFELTRERQIANFTRED